MSGRPTLTSRTELQNIEASIVLEGQKGRRLTLDAVRKITGHTTARLTLIQKRAAIQAERSKFTVAECQRLLDEVAATAKSKAAHPRR